MSDEEIDPDTKRFLDDANDDWESELWSHRKQLKALRDPFEEEQLARESEMVDVLNALNNWNDRLK